MNTVYGPYTARQCPDCGEWVPVKPQFSDYEHWEANHAPEDLDKDAQCIGFPFFSYNDQVVRV